MSTTPDPLEEQLEALLQQARHRLDELRRDFDREWRHREIVRALYAFQRFRDLLDRNLAWEEPPLVAASARPDDGHGAQRHRRHHAQIRKVCIDVLELLARRIWMGGCVDGDVDDRLAALDHLLEQHRTEELPVLRSTLAGHLDAAALARLAIAIEEPARPVAP